MGSAHSPMNRKDSSGDEFMTWWSTVKDDPEKMETLGGRIYVFGLFGKDHWGSDSFTMGTARSVDEIRRDARNIWFAYKKLIVLAEVMSHAYISLGVVESSIVAVTDDLIYHFTQQPDLLADAQCQMAKVISDLIFAAWVVVAYEKYSDQTEKYRKGAKFASNNIQTVSNIITPVDGIVSADVQAQQARIPTGHNSTKANGPLHIMQDYQGDICSLWDTKIRYKSFGNPARTKKYVEDQFISYEESISRVWSGTFLKNDNIEAQTETEILDECNGVGIGSMASE
ncbi:hypothetical protein BDZ45DRAFT_698421 [Acephala macrosclerotiorum]|nr:hypothetical protein BDZ45DRAFT_698421 [Acephala macrosclerotiorum]